MLRYLILEREVKAIYDTNSKIAVGEIEVEGMECYYYVLVYNLLPLNKIEKIRYNMCGHKHDALLLICNDGFKIALVDGRIVGLTKGPYGLEYLELVKSEIFLSMNFWMFPEIVYENDRLVETGL